MPRKGSDQSDLGDAGDETEVRGDDLRTTFISRSALLVVKTYVGVLSVYWIGQIPLRAVFFSRTYNQIPSTIREVRKGEKVPRSATISIPCFFLWNVLTGTDTGV